MNSVIRTKTPKIAMLTAGLPIVSSAATTSGTVAPLAGGAGRVLVLLEALAHLVGDGIGGPRGVPDVQLGDQEGRDELAQTEQQAQVDVAEDPRLHERRGERGEQDVQEVPGQERDGRGDDEAAKPLAQFRELGRVLSLAVLLRRQDAPVGRSGHWAAFL